MPKYKVELEIRLTGYQTVEVEADDADDAAGIAVRDADMCVNWEDFLNHADEDIEASDEPQQIAAATK